MAKASDPKSSVQMTYLLQFAVASVLCLLAFTSFALTGKQAIATLTWGFENIITPVSSELKHSQQVNYGIYEFGKPKSFSEAKGLAIEHIFVSWLDSNIDLSIGRSFESAHSKNRWLMITIEPFALGEHIKERLLRDIVDGVYDKNIASVCESIGSLQYPVFVRWGHEMEKPAERYPWSGASGVIYVAAYRYFVDKCRASAPSILFVWSPKGEFGLDEFYPGREYSDYIGLSLYSLPAYDIDYFGRILKFKEAFSPKYERVKKYNRPVMIAELGVAGDPQHQKFWMADLIRNLEYFPLLKSIVYFNAKDSVGAWPKKFGTPDWKIDPETFE